MSLNSALNAPDRFQEPLCQFKEAVARTGNGDALVSGGEIGFLNEARTLHFFGFESLDHADSLLRELASSLGLDVSIEVGVWVVITFASC